MKHCWCGERFSSARQVREHVRSLSSPDHFECPIGDLNGIGYRCLRTGKSCTEVRAEMRKETWRWNG